MRCNENILPLSVMPIIYCWKYSKWKTTNHIFNSRMLGVVVYRVLYSVLCHKNRFIIIVDISNLFLVFLLQVRRSKLQLQLEITYDLFTMWYLLDKTTRNMLRNEIVFKISQTLIVFLKSPPQPLVTFQPL